MSYKAILLARQAAREILKNYSRESRTFVDVKQIVTDLKINFVEGRFVDSKQRDISGLIKFIGKEGRPVIAVRETDSEERKRFTIAHELGHYFLHQKDLLHMDGDVEAAAFRDASSSLATKLKEVQANQFAAELLMPTREIEELLREKMKSNPEMDVTELIREISNTYRVSTMAATIKISSLMGSIVT